MAFCPNCGCELPEGAKFCGNCGARQLPPETPAEPVVPETEIPAYTFEETPAEPVIPATETPAYTFEETPAVEESPAEEPPVIEPPAAAEPVSYGQPAAYRQPTTYQQPAAEENSYGYSSPREDRGPEEETEKKKIGPLPFILGGVALVVLVIVLVLFVGKKSNKTSSTKVETETVQTTGKSKVNTESGKTAGKTKADEEIIQTSGKSKAEVPAADPAEGEETEEASDKTAGKSKEETPAADPAEKEKPEEASEPEPEQPGVVPPEEASEPTAVQEFWDGDWYGWWGVYDCTGEYTDAEGMWWDCCARIETEADLTGTIRLWDEDTSDENPLMLAEISILELDDLASGVAFSTSGQFLDMDLSDSGCALTNDTDFDRAIDILGEYEDDEGGFSYVFFMLPWGADWSEVEETDETLMPYYYDWYLEQMEAGVTNAPGEIG
ncbi:MAG: zinc-ribbon domain-containing protein [Oscillospiraceae bacterium]